MKKRKGIKTTVIAPRWWTILRKWQRRGRRALMWIGLVTLVVLLLRMFGGG